MIIEKEKVPIQIIKETNTKETGKAIKKRVKEHIQMQSVTGMLVIGWMVKEMEKVPIHL